MRLTHVGEGGKIASKTAARIVAISTEETAFFAADASSTGTRTRYIPARRFRLDLGRLASPWILCIPIALEFSANQGKTLSFEWRQYRRVK